MIASNHAEAAIEFMAIRRCIVTVLYDGSINGNRATGGITPAI